MGFFKRDPQPALDWVRFDASSYADKGEPRPGTRLWFTPEGDSVGVYTFTVPPDLPRVETVDALRGYYSDLAKASGGRCVETAVVRVAEVPAVQVITALPQRPSGTTFVAAITLPFRDCSAVVKIQCEERGMTGVREAVLLDRRFTAGDMPAVRDSQKQLPDGFQPDAAEHDAEFPSSPVSRARRFLDHARRTIVLDPLLARRPRFPLPRLPI